MITSTSSLDAVNVCVASNQPPVIGVSDMKGIVGLVGCMDSLCGWDELEYIRALKVMHG